MIRQISMDPLTYVEDLAHPRDVTNSAPDSGRIQLALNVDDLDQAVDFYSRLFAVEPVKRRPGYANFAIARPPLKLVLLESPGHGGTLNHLGVEVPSSDAVVSEVHRLRQAGLVADEEMGTTCCYAEQDKAWISGPGGEQWEIYTVLADSDSFGAVEDETCRCCGHEQTLEIATG
jgi:lactoylglutathione lyase